MNLADPSGESPTAVLGGALAGAGKALLASIKTLVVASVVVIAGILVVDLINNAIQAKQNEQALKVAQAEDELPNIASGYGNLKCKEAASAMQRYLKKNKLHGAFVTLSFPNAHNGFVVSKSKGGDAISRNGIHMGILFNGKIYCNVHPYGLPKQMWINDFEASAPPRNYYEMKF